MAEMKVYDDASLAIIEGLISKLTVAVLTKRGLYSSSGHGDHHQTVFCSKDSKHGDLLIRKEFLREFLMNVAKDFCTSDKFKALLGELVHDMTYLKTSSEELQYYLAEIKPSSVGHINVWLHRPHCFAAFIGKVTRRGVNYGTVPAMQKTIHLYSHDFFPRHVSIEHCKSEKYCKEFYKLSSHSVNQARGVLLTSLLCNLLTAIGYTVVIINDSTCYKEPLFESIFLAPKVLKYISNQPAESSPNTCCVELKEFLSERNLIGRGGYSGAINKVTVKCESGLTPTGNKVMDMTKTIPVKTLPNTTVIHIVHSQMSYDVEKAIAIFLLVTDSNVQQNILVHSGIKSDDKELFFSQLLKGRELLSMEACRVRYSSTIADSHLENVSSKMAEASIKFDLLSVDPKCQVHLRRHQSADLRSNGSFVLYNYARIATIMSKFEAAIKKGVYPPLPILSSIDFSLLTDENEWTLLFQYVAAFPSVLKEVTTLQKQGLGLYVTSSIKKLCLFLVNLAHEFSVYYSKVKILLEPQGHLLPLMYARLALVSSVKQVLYNGLKLLSIEPIDQL